MFVAQHERDMGAMERDMGAMERDMGAMERDMGAIALAPYPIKPEWVHALQKNWVG